MDAGERVGVLLAAKALVKRQRERVGACHIFLRERLRGGRRRWAFYSASPGGQPCKAPQLVTWPRIFIGSRGSGWWRLWGAEFLLAAAATRVNLRLVGDAAAGAGDPSAGEAD